MTERFKPSSVELVNKNSTESEDIYELVPLPSRGRLYPENHPYHNCEFVEIKRMSTDEEDILSTPALLKQGTVLNVLMRSCLANKFVDTTSLLLGDKSAILLAIRLSGFGGEFLQQTICPSCNYKFNHQFDLSKVQIKELGADPIQEGSNLFEYTLKSGKKIKLSLMTDGDDLEIAKMQENKKKALKKPSLIDTTKSDRLKRQIKDFDGETDPEKISALVKRMPAIQAKELRKFIAKIEPDMIMKETVTCPSCGESKDHAIPMSLDFFWPSDED
jgi:hypothetical protein